MYLSCVMLNIKALLRLSQDKNRSCKELWILLVFDASRSVEKRMPLKHRH